MIVLDTGTTVLFYESGVLAALMLGSAIIFKNLCFIKPSSPLVTSECKLLSGSVFEFPRSLDSCWFVFCFDDLSIFTLVT